MNLLPFLSAITLASGWISASDCSIRDSSSFTQNANGDEEIASKNRTVCIDPGHPSEVNSGNTVQNGTTETHIDWAVAKKLQKALISLGYPIPHYPSQIFGKETRSALWQFQVARGIGDNGRHFGPLSRAALGKVVVRLALLLSTLQTCAPRAT